MSKIICDICGTTYPDTAECCPICGCTRDEALLLGEELLMEDTAADTRGKGGRFAPKKKKEIFDFDEVNGDAAPSAKEEENPYDEDDDYEEAPQHNTFAVILLTILIAALLLAAGFLFVRYYLPNMRPVQTVPTTAAVQTQAADETQELSFPCQTLTLTSGTAELSTEGAFFLIHAVPFPENTTDKIIYQSADETIATVDENGKVTAVAEGETVVYITCGTQQIICDVICKFQPETQPVTEATEAPTEAETVPETAPETTSGLKDVELKLTQKDITLPIGTYWTLKLDCDLAPEDVEWSSNNNGVATVNEQGRVDAKNKGTTKVVVKYGDQVVECVIRCK